MKKFVTRQLREQLQSQATRTPTSVLKSVVGNSILNKIDNRDDASAGFSSAQVMHSVGTAMLTKQHVAAPLSHEGTNLAAFPELRKRQKHRNEAAHGQADRFGVQVLDVAQHCALIYDIGGDPDSEPTGADHGHGHGHGSFSIPGFTATVTLGSVRCDPSFEQYTYGTDMAYSLYIPTADTYLIVFRGTVADNMLQWAQNVATPLTQIKGWFADPPAPPPPEHKRWFGLGKKAAPAPAAADGVATRKLKELGWEANADALVRKFVSRQLELQSNAAAGARIPVSRNLARSRFLCCGHSRGGYLSLLGGSYLRGIIKDATKGTAKVETVAPKPSWFRTNMFWGAAGPTSTTDELTHEQVAVVGFGMPVVNSLSEDALRNIGSVSCFIHINDAVGQYNIEKAHVDVHLSSSMLQTAGSGVIVGVEADSHNSTRTSNGDCSEGGKGEGDKRGAWGNVMSAVSSVSNSVSSAVSAGKDLSLLAHSMDTYIADVAREMRG